MTTYVVPCGVSILDGIKNHRGKPPEASGSSRLSNVAETWAAHARLAADSGVVNDWWATLGEALDEAMLRDWRWELSAETSTLAARIPALSTLLADGHTVVLLTSDTDPGLAAAMLVATCLATDAVQVRYATVPVDLDVGAWTHRFAPGTVTVVRVVGLDPRRPAGLRSATAGIGRALRTAHDSEADGSIEVHLTSGLKATLLHTMTMTEVLHALPGAQVTAWYLYDDTSRPEAVPIDLRRLSPEDLELLRGELCRVRDGHATGGRVFFGTGWTEQDGQRQLTAFGTGFLAVLGEPTSRIGDDGIGS